MPWSAADDEFLRQFYRSSSASNIAASINRTPKAVINRAYKLGISVCNEWTAGDLKILWEEYGRAGKDGVLKLDELAQKLGKLKSNVCRKARELGLTNQKRKVVETRKDRRKFEDSAERSAYMSRIARERIAANGHPRGALGMKHTKEALEIIAEKSRVRWASLTQEERDAHQIKAMKGRVRNGVTAPKVARGKWKAGWREVGGQRVFFRSRWEANYARYLEWLCSIGQIMKWEHEPKTFWFEGVKRGCVSYLPDFRVTNKDESHEWHEVKGWMDARSATTIKRMIKYHPAEKLLVIREKEYRAIERKVAGVISGWEL